MNLVVDVGNSSVKAGWFNDQTCVDVQRFSGLDTLEAYLLKEEHSIQEVLICSVKAPEQKELAGRVVHWLSEKSPLPIGLNYDTPDTLGKDRLAAAAGAKVLYPDQDCLIIDAGSCVTYDFLDRQGTFQGGMIAPGYAMRLKAMHHFTARLPEVENNDAVKMIEKSTRSGMQSGSYWGMLSEIEGVIQRYRSENEKLTIILTGGDALLFESKIKAPIFVVSNLVLEGLNSILRLYVQRKI